MCVALFTLALATVHRYNPIRQPDLLYNILNPKLTALCLVYHSQNQKIQTKNVALRVREGEIILNIAKQ